MNAIRTALLKDLKEVGIDTSKFDLILRPYSKTYYGRYFYETHEMYIYVFEDTHLRRFYPYSHLLEVAIHEAVHSIQWYDPKFKRKKNIMHDSEFKKLFMGFLKKSKEIHRREIYLSVL